MIHIHTRMKISKVSAAPFLLVLCNTFVSSRSTRREKISVFDWITDIWQGEEPVHASANHATVLNKVVDDDKEITFEDLRKMFRRNNNEKEAGKEENNTNLSRKEAIKKQFLEKIHRKNRSKISNRKKENIIVNFSFLTKMS